MILARSELLKLIKEEKLIDDIDEKFVKGSSIDLCIGKTAKNQKKD